jgi:hypothetical protein
MLHLANEHFRTFVRAHQGSGELPQALFGQELGLLTAIYVSGVSASLNFHVSDMCLSAGPIATVLHIEAKTAFFENRQIR